MQFETARIRKLQLHLKIYEDSKIYFYDVITNKLNGVLSPIVRIKTPSKQCVASFHLCISCQERSKYPMFHA